MVEQDSMRGTENLLPTVEAEITRNQEETSLLPPGPVIQAIENSYRDVDTSAALRKDSDATMVASRNSSLVAASSPKPNSTQSTPLKLGKDSGPKMHILVVDDDP